MLIHLASYPRSGNAWIRRLLCDQFRYLTASIYGAPVVQQEQSSHEDWLTEDHFKLIDDLPTNERTLFLRYVSIDPPTSERVLLMPGNRKRLENASFRQRLARSEHRFFIKTHCLPYPSYFPGELVVQPIRHPGATLWSYFNFLRDVNRKKVSLEAVIEAKVGFGCWSHYHTAWESVANKMGDNLLRVRYESLFGNELSFCRRMAELIQSPILSENVKPFSFYHAREPLLARCGRPDDWRAHYSPQQMTLLEQRHGQQMQRLGYCSP